MTNCVICATKKRNRELEYGHVCAACEHALNVDLGHILDLVALGSTQPTPLAVKGNDGASSRPVPDSRPPLDVARIDPANTAVKVDDVPVGEDEDGIPLLAMLEAWARRIRAARGLTSYGVATEPKASFGVAHMRPVPWADTQKVRAFDLSHDVAHVPTRVTLVDVIRFLRTNVPWAVADEDFPVAELATQVHRALSALRRFDPTLEPTNAWQVPCPGDDPDDDPYDPARAGEPLDPCLYKIRVEYGPNTSIHDDIVCPRCGSSWTPQRLLLVALNDDRVTIWHYPDTIRDALGVPGRTLRRWAEKGLVDKRGSLYDVGQAYRTRRDTKETA